MDVLQARLVSSGCILDTTLKYFYKLAELSLAGMYCAPVLAYKGHVNMKSISFSGFILHTGHKASSSL